jgi:hypothetical protein
MDAESSRRWGPVMLEWDGGVVVTGRDFFSIDFQGNEP